MAGHEQLHSSKLDEIVEKKTGNTTQYLNATVALRDDLISYFDQKFTKLEKDIWETRKALERSLNELKTARDTEQQLRLRISELEGKVKDGPKTDLTNEFYIVGTSLFRDVRSDDVINGQVKSIRGGKIKDVKDDLQKLKNKPKAIMTQVGGNDLCAVDATVDDVSAEYSILLTETKAKFPESDLIVSGLPPRFPTDEIRTKIKDFNDTTKGWCEANGLKFIDNNDCFELKNGEIDSSAYVMSGETPKVHLTRRGTVRLLENMKNQVPELQLSKNIHNNQTDTNYTKQMSYAGVLRSNRYDGGPTSRQQPSIDKQEYYRRDAIIVENTTTK